MNRASRLLVTAGLALACLLAGADAAAQAQWWSRATQGFRSAADTAMVPSSPSPSALIRGNVGAHEAPAVAEFATFSREGFRDSRGARIVVLAQAGRVLFEDRTWTTSRSATPLGFSMSKSLTALSVGQALCDGRIRSLEDRAEAYVPALGGTSWGRASVRQLLTMSSGGTATDRRGWHDQAASDAHLPTYDGQMRDNYLDLMRAADQHLPEGFRYSNYDTLALGLVVEQATGEPLAGYFARKICAPAGTREAGAWLRNRAGQVATYVGFSATADDWIRLGFWTLAQREADSCFGAFLRDATRKQLSADFFTQSYGYQVWTDCVQGTDAFCFWGYGGQLLVLSPQRKLVLYAHSVSPSHGTDHVWLPAFRAAWDLLGADGMRQPVHSHSP